MKSIFYYKDYRRFIEDFFNFKKSEGSFTLETFSRLAGVKSRSYFKSIIDGTRDLNFESAFSVAKAMSLNLSEQQFFENLVYENQSISSEQKQYYRAILAKFKKGTVVLKTKSSQLLDYPFFLSALTLLSDHRNGVHADRFTTLLKIKRSDADIFLSKMVDAGIIWQESDYFFYNSTHCFS